MFRRIQARVLILAALCLAFDAVLAVEEMQTRVFHVPPSFMFLPYDQAEPTTPDPFGSPVESPPPGFVRSRLSSREILQSAGITFPGGATSFWDSKTGNLTIRNTQPNLEVTEVYVEELHRHEAKTVHLLIRIFEVSREVWTAIKSDQAAASSLTEVTAVAGRSDGTARLIDTLWIDSLNNRPAVLRSITDGADDLHIDSSAPSKPLARSATGDGLEFSPVIMADGQTAEGMLKLTLSPSEELSASGTSSPTAEFAKALVQTHVRIADGEKKLLAALPKPATLASDTSDRFWLFFAEGRLLNTHQEKSREQTPHPLPSGLQQVERKIPSGLLQVAAIPPRSKQLEQWINKQFAKEIQLSQEDLALEPIDLFLKREGIPPQAGSSFKMSGGQIRIENTLENIERVDAMLTRLHQKAPKDSQFVLHVVEANDQFLDENAARALSHTDHSSEWTRIAEEIQAGRASIVHTSWSVTSGEASILAGAEHAHIEGLQMESHSHPGALLGLRSTGLDWSVSDQTQVGEQNMETHVRFEVDSSLPTLRHASLRDNASSRAYDVPFTEFHRAILARTMMILDGCAKFLGTWHPASKPELRAQGRRYAAFLRHQQIAILPRGGVFETGDRLPDENSQALKTKTYEVPRDFLLKVSTSCFGQPEAPPLDPYADPFAPPNSQSCGIFSPRHGLLASGAVFGEGSSAAFQADKSQFIVRNTAGNLSLIDEFVEDLWRTEEKSITIKLHVFEAAAPSILRRVEECFPIADHLPVLTALLGDGNTRLVTSALLQTKSGTSATVKQAVEYKHPSNQNLRPAVKTRDVGLIFEASPVVRADGHTVAMQVKLHHDVSPPVERLEHITEVKTSTRIDIPLTDFHRVEIKTCLNMIHGTARLIGIWEPTATSPEKRLQAAFITCELTPMRP